MKYILYKYSFLLVVIHTVARPATTCSKSVSIDEVSLQHIASHAVLVIEASFEELHCITPTALVCAIGFTKGIWSVIFKCVKIPSDAFWANMWTQSLCCMFSFQNPSLNSIRIIKRIPYADLTYWLLTQNMMKIDKPRYI